MAKEIGIAVFVFIAILWFAICISASIHDEKGRKIPEGHRLRRFLYIFPWPF